jgi:hypothetical protein
VRSPPPAGCSKPLRFLPCALTASLFWRHGWEIPAARPRARPCRCRLRVVAAPAAAHHHDAPSPDASEIGDPLFPGLGNGGYDAIHYSLALRYPTADAQQTVSGRVTMFARATQALSRFDLDFAGDSVDAVTVDGRSAGFTWSDEEIVITPRHALRDGEKFAVTVRYTATPFVPTDVFPFGFFTVHAGSVTAGQPNLSHTFYPVNDHPADKASYDISFDVPAGTTAVANGDLVYRRTSHGRTYFMREPMASELIQLTVGALDDRPGRALSVRHLRGRGG